jgi:hypothetical protein
MKPPKKTELLPKVTEIKHTYSSDAQETSNMQRTPNESEKKIRFTEMLGSQLKNVKRLFD